MKLGLAFIGGFVTGVGFIFGLAHLAANLAEDAMKLNNDTKRRSYAVQR